MQNSLYLSFASGVTDRQFKFNERKKSVRTLSLKAYTSSGTTAAVAFIDMASFSAITATEGLQGAPIPLIGNGQLFEEPLPLFNCAQNAVLTLRVRLRNADGTALTHTGFNMWLVVDAEPQPYSLPMVAAEHLVGVASGAGTNDNRWAYLPQTVAEAQAPMHEAFSKLNSL